MELQNLEMNMWILIALVTFCGIVLSYEDIYDRPRTTGKASGFVTSCKTTLQGVDYRGNINKTKGGISCQRWSSQTPHKHDEDPYSRQDANYCRNPDREPFGPWCYTTDPDIRWDYCDVPLCHGAVVSNQHTVCKNTSKGEDYRGKINTTKSGRACQRWDTQTPHNHKNTPERNPAKDLVDNYCRNPDAETRGPWCYTTDKDKRWEQCDVPKCYDHCKRSSLGQEYRGIVNVTKSGNSCLPWSTSTQKNETWATSTALTDNFCRNPNGKEYGPWCYINGNNSWEYCEIPRCPEACQTTEFSCVSDTKCILKSWKCDGENDCSDGSDEMNCNPTEVASCDSTQFQCGSGKCIPKGYVCDGDKDCDDEFDERNCTQKSCTSEEFTCTDGKCILRGWRCDGENDCLDGTDEKNCGNKESTCAPHHFKCSNGRCIKTEWKCDHDNDCGDWSDETKCNKTTKGCNDEQHFRCLNGGCVSKYFACDGINDCGDNSDEGFCKSHCLTTLSYKSISSPQDSKLPPTLQSNQISLNNKKSAWCSSKKDGPQYVLIDFGEMRTIREIVTLGYPAGSEPGTANYTMQFAYENTTFYNYTEEGHTKIFPGNPHPLIRRKSSFWSKLRARYVKIHTQSTAGQDFACMRLGILGCKEGVKPHTTSPESVSLPRPSSGQIQMIVCTIDGQRGLQASWKLLVRDKTWIPLTRTSKLFNTDTTILSPSSGFHVRLISTLTVRLDQEMVTMNCTVSSDYVDCSARLMCTGSYPDNDIGPEQSSVTLIDAGRLKFPSKPSQLRFSLLDSRSVRLTWMLAEKGDLPLTKETRVIYWAKGSRLNLTNDSVGPYHLQLNNLKPYTTYNAVVVLRATDKIRQTVPHIPEYLRISEKIMFTTKVEVLLQRINEDIAFSSLETCTEIESHQTTKPQSDKAPSGSPTDVAAISRDVGSIVLHWKAPPSASQNGPIDGYFVSYRRVKIGPVEVSEDKKTVEVKGQNFAKLTKLKPWSTYEITTTAYNLLENRKLESKPSQAYHSSTSADKPSVAPSQVSARTVSNSITVTWSVPSINDVNGPVDGSKIRLNELRLNPSNKRRKRHIESKVTVIDVKGQQTIKTIQLSEDTVWCIIEVAIYTDNGLGPYSPPLTVHMDKNNTKVNKNGSVNNVDKHGGDNHVGPYHPDKDHDSKNKVDGDNDNMVGAKQSKGKEKSSDFFTKGLGFYILLGVSVLFLIVIVILAFKMNRDRKLANWEHQHKNGRVCYRAERMEPFLLDGESGETVSDQVQLGSFGSTDEKMQLTAPNHL